MSDVRALAGGLGVETHFWDVKGQRHEAGDDALRAVLAAMGVAVDEDVDDDDGTLAAAVETFVATVGGPVTDPVVAWGDDDLRAWVVVPDKRRTFTVTLHLEGGGRRAATFETRNLPVADPAAPTALGPHPAPGEQARWFTLPGPVPVGYHEIEIDLGKVQVAADVIVAPPTVTTLGDDERLWGIFAPIYALPGGSGVGGHVGNLAALARVMDDFGGKIVATLPLLATFLGEPFDPSPYAPVSRRFWNELFCDLAALAELAAVPAAADDLDGLRRFGHAANIKAKAYDYRHQAGYVRGVLEQVVAGRARWSADARKAYAAFEREQPDVVDYARFRAYAEQQGTGWLAWPEPARSGTITDDDVDQAVVAVHVYAQYAMQRDLRRLTDDLAARGQHLYLDLPVGAHSEGYDTWKQRDVFAWGVAAGAPPDDFFAGGQNWGFPPLRPHGAGNEAIFHFRAVVRHHMATAGILRLDHAMCLERLFWVPDGMDAADGVYVRYPREALLAVLAIESGRHGCVVVGEDLGTVSDTIRDAMDRRGLLGMYVAEFTQPAWDGAELELPRERQLASIDTHDTPTFAGWLHGLDIDRRHMFALLDDAAADEARAERRAQVHNLVRFLTRIGAVRAGTGPADEAALLAGLLRVLGDSPAQAMLVAIDDLVLERNPQNVPGTLIDRPNWVQRVRLSVEELVADEQVTSLLQALQGCRLGSHVRARNVAADPAPDRDDA